MKKAFLFFILIASLLSYQAFPFQIPGNPIFIEEQVRRASLSDRDSSYLSYSTRPLAIPFLGIELFKDLPDSSLGGVNFSLLPLYSQTQLNTNRPYGFHHSITIPNVGFQQYLSLGVYAKWKFASLQFQPEIVFAQNKGYEGYPDDFSNKINKDRFVFWNWGDFPERFGTGSFTSAWWGQSKASLGYGAFELYVGTNNIWWGPGQFNALTFSSNAPGFPHLSLNTSKPAKTFLGHFEGQIISGRIKDSGLSPSQFEGLNNTYFVPFTGDWKYVNAINFVYSPKWIQGLSIGFNRTFQVYHERMGTSFLDYFPIFSGLVKEQFFNNGSTVEFDSNGRDEQFTVFYRWEIPKWYFEFYMEYGRADHSFNWREFILNPEHSRAFILGFNKLFALSGRDKFIQIRSEMTHQQEPINRIVRYTGTGGYATWHNHYQARGFTHKGQSLGTAAGLGVNVQTLEVALVKGFKKLGLVFERAENLNDFYYKAQFQFTERKPWTDLSLGFLYDKQFNNLLLSSKLQLIHARNYQWQLHPSSTPEFPRGQNLTSVMAQVSAIYFWKKK